MFDDVLRLVSIKGISVEVLSVAIGRERNKYGRKRSLQREIAMPLAIFASKSTKEINFRIIRTSNASTLELRTKVDEMTS